LRLTQIITETAVLASAGYALIARQGIVLTAALLSAGAGRGENISSMPLTGPLVSGLFRTPPVTVGNTAPNSLSLGPIRDADILLPTLEVLPPTFGGAAGLASRIVAAEGGPQPNSASSAVGYGQFLRGTWLQMFASAYPGLAQKLSSEQILALREVKPLALELTDRYARENALSLRRVGLPATEASLSLAHAVGAGGAINVLVSHADEPLQKVLSREAIAANPFMREMTASTLHRWALDRIRVPAEPARPKRATTRLEEEFEPLRPTEDFRLDGRTKASQALAQNRDAIAALRNLLEAASKMGVGKETQLDPSTEAWLNSVGVDPVGLLVADRTAVRVFNEAAARLVLETIHSLATRAAYREFIAIESTAGANRTLRPAVIRDVARAVIEKMRGENQTITAIVRHRRRAGTGASDGSP
jgi:hypothetical protein